ncbi:C40 family peptidase [Hamadaea tsunoensis]|uniref:C40 family peptidase n=1 Tax=Hamadaea tsunoensis TaxID=53368 RepID=UPI0004030BA1|nr:C40 family peptidase [Hamadaea tsunoensis]
MPPLRTVYRGLIALLGAVVIGLAPTAVYAAPSVSEIEKQIDEEWQKLEPLVEQYNKVHTALQKNQKKASDLSKRIAPLALQVDVSLGQVGDMASQFYMVGAASRLTALLNAKSPDQFLDQLGFLNEIASQQQEAIEGVSKQKSVYDGQKEQLDALIAQQKQQDATLAAQKKVIQAEMDRLQKLRIQAYGTSTVGGSLRIGVCPPVLPSGKRATAVKKACSLIGKPYVWGSDGPNSYDCSGLTKAAWAAAGISLDHFTGDQWGQSHYVPKASLQPGDLVFFYGDHHHVGIYIGNGLMVHAPHSGDQVRMAYISNMPITPSGTRSVL